MKTNKVIVSSFLILLFPALMVAQTGKDIFTTTCTACHSIGKGTVVGPDLKDVEQRYDEAWIAKWIRGSQAMVKAKDPKAVEIFTKFNMIPMPDQALTDAQIKDLLAYIKSESAQTATSKSENDNTKVANASAANASDGKKGSSDKPASIGDSNQTGNAIGENEGKTPINPDTMFMLLGFALLGAFFLAIILSLTHSIKRLSHALEHEYKNGK